MKASTKTCERIVGISLGLFNAHGERSTSTNHIAAAADISSGNLYYHFANKQQIVAVLFARYQARVSNVLRMQPPGAFDAQRLQDCLEQITTAIWEYRFIYRDLEHLLDADPGLAASHRAFSLRCLEEGRALLEGLCRGGLLRMTTQERHAVAINAWLILTSWVRYLYTMRSSSMPITAAHVRRGAWQALNLLRTYATPEASPALQAIMASFKSKDTCGQSAALATGTSA